MVTKLPAQEETASSFAGWTGAAISAWKGWSGVGGGGWSPLEVALGGDKLGRGHRLGWDPAENEIHHPSG